MLEARGQLGQFGLRHRSHLGVGVRGHGLGLFDSVGDLLVFAELFNGLFEVAMGFGGFVHGFAGVLDASRTKHGRDAGGLRRRSAGVLSGGGPGHQDQQRERQQATHRTPLSFR